MPPLYPPGAGAPRRVRLGHPRGCSTLEPQRTPAQAPGRTSTGLLVPRSPRWRLPDADAAIGAGARLHARAEIRGDALLRTACASAPRVRLRCAMTTLTSAPLAMRLPVPCGAKPSVARSQQLA